MCVACSLFDLVKRKPMTERRRMVVSLVGLTASESFRFRGLLSDAGYRFEAVRVGGQPALRVWVLDWS